tara:strand:+ start:774 stop:1031 length:258 start_codon:yes stop_codon:yes gene_type:complete
MNDHMFEISVLNSEMKPLKVSPSIYGSLVNCIGLRATISHVGEIRNNQVDIGVEKGSSGWTRASLETALQRYPSLSETVIQVKDK